MNDDELKVWRDGFSKYGFTLHPGLTPEQNAAEIRKGFDKVHERWTASVEAYKRSNVELRKERDAALLQAGDMKERLSQVEEIAKGEMQGDQDLWGMVFGIAAGIENRKPELPMTPYDTSGTRGEPETPA